MSIVTEYEVDFLKHKQTIYISAAVALVAIAALFYMSLPKAGGEQAGATLAGTAVSTEEQTSTEQAETTAETAVSVTTLRPSTEKATAASIINVVELGSTTDGKIKIGFTGDINLDETLETGPMQFYKLGVNTILDFIDPVLVGRLRAADILFVNNEFAFSDRGEKQVKTYTFRANPANVSVYKELGVKVASIANNHIYDFKADAMRDTITTIEGAGIACVGGGRKYCPSKKGSLLQS